MTDAPEPTGRFWRRIFQHATEPLFLLNRHRRLVFVNHAWEALTGLPFAAVRKCNCKRYRDAAPGSPQAAAAALRPPPEVLTGQVVHVRRLFPVATGAAQRWRVTFVPFQDAAGTVGVLGKIQLLPPDAPASQQALPDKLLALRDRQAQWFTPDYLDSDLPAMQRLGEQVRLAARTRVPVLLVGEAGVGKQWLGRLIHLQGDTAARPFVVLDAERLPGAALAALLFDEPGLLRRPFTGTVYLREPAALPRDLQERLLQWLHGESVDAPTAPRLLAGCQGDPRADVAGGRLLEALACGLSTFTIAVPPLRERLADLDWLCERLLQRATEGTPSPAQLTPAALELLRGQPWPGNLRELYNVLADAAGRGRGERIEAADLPWYLRPVAPPSERGLPLDAILEQVERRLLRLALEMAQQNQTRAAELLAVWRPRLLRRLKALGIE